MPTPTLRALTTVKDPRHFGSFFKGGRFVSLGNRRFFWAHRDACELLDATSGEVSKLSAGVKYPEALAASVTGEHVVICEDGGWVRVVTLDPSGKKKPKQVRKRLHPSNALSGATFSGEQVIVVAPGEEANKYHGDVLVLNAKTFDEVARVPNAGVVMGGGSVITTTAKGGFELWRAPWKKPQQLAALKGFTPVSISADGQVALASSDTDDQLLLLSLETREELGRVKAPRAAEVRDWWYLPSASSILRVTVSREMNGNIEEIAVERWPLKGKVERVTTRLVAKDLVLGIAEVPGLAHDVVVLNRELAVDL